MPLTVHKTERATIRVTGAAGARSACLAENPRQDGGAEPRPL